MLQTTQQRPRPSVEAASFLRNATADVHARLESRLQWLRPPLHRTRFLQAIERFYGFHLAWEERVTRHAPLSRLLDERSRMAALEHDLVELGVPRASFADIERCDTGLEFLDCRSAALGSCYVIEGATLGGQIISRAISGERWAPPGGLRTFNPYGEKTGAMWRAFRLWLDRESLDKDRDAMAAGARATFVRLGDWLAT